MSKVLASTIEGLTYKIDFLVEKAEYEDFKSRVIDQILKTVEVKGFRKGFAPRDMALKQINPMFLQQNLLNEVLDKYGVEATEAAKIDLKEKNRVGLSFDLSSDSETMKEDETGFRFQLECRLLPAINIDAVTSVTFAEPTEAELVGRPSYADFVEAEKARFITRYNVYKISEDEASAGDKLTVNMTGTVEGVTDARLAAQNFVFTIGTKEVLPGFEAGVTGLKATDKKTFPLTFPADYFEENLQNKDAEFSVEVLQVERAEYFTVSEIIDNSEEAKKQFESEEKFDEFLKDFYAKQTKTELEQIRQRNIIGAVVEQTPEIELEEETIEAEVKRITQALVEQAESTKISIGQAYLQNSLPTDDAKKVEKMDELQIQKEVEKYVRNEFKLSQILSYIYEVKVEKKPTAKEFDDTLKQVKANPQQFNVDPNASEEQIRGIVLDRIVRQLAANWLFETLDVTAKK